MYYQIYLLEGEVVKENKFYDLILGIIVLSLAILMLIDSQGIPVGVLDKQIGFVASPKGFIILIGSALLLLSILLIIQAIKKIFLPVKKEEKTVRPIEKNESIMPKEVFISMILFLVYVATIRTFGFFINSFILLVIFMTMYYLKEKRVDIKDKIKIRKVILNVVVISIISLFVLQQIFVRLLGVSLPKGIFGF
jgi:hypothetical protein